MLGQRDQTSLSAGVVDLQPASHRGPTLRRIAAPDWLVLSPHVRVSDLSRELAYYLELGYEVQSAADGCALLTCGNESFVLVQASLPTASRAPAPHLTIVGPVVSEPVELVEDHGLVAVAAGPGPSAEWAS